MRVKRKNDFLSGSFESKEFINIAFDNLTIRNASFHKTTFKNLHFKNSYLGFSSSYSYCVFENCKFFGKYSSLGNTTGKPTVYRSCNFENCEFIGLDILAGTSFIDCSFSGMFKNVILLDASRGGTSFLNCSLEHLIFKDLSIYGKEVFINSTLPNSGLLLLDNRGNELISRAAERCSKVPDDSKIETAVIFNANTRNGQNMIILDKYFIDSFFKSDKSRKFFEEVIDGYEIKNIYS